MKCLRCGVELHTDFMEPTRQYLGLSRPLCPKADLLACLNRAAALVDPPEEPPVEDDLPPEDMDRCSHCSGRGIIYTSEWPDWETGARPRVTCPVCEGSKMQPVSP